MWQVIAVAAAYVFGGFCTGYYIVRFTKGIDIREIGSGSAGGTNAARVLGPWWRYVVGALDLLKGTIAVGAALWLGMGEVAVGAVVLAVVLGHVYPAQLGFRGGKGIGTSFGALLVYSPPTALAVFGTATVLLLLTKRLQVSGVIAYTVGAAMVPVWEASAVVWLFVAVTTALVVYANRANFVRELRSCFASGSAGDGR